MTILYWLPEEAREKWMWPDRKTGPWGLQNPWKTEQCSLSLFGWFFGGCQDLIHVRLPRWSPWGPTLPVLVIDTNLIGWLSEHLAMWKSPLSLPVLPLPLLAVRRVLLFRPPHSHPTLHSSRPHRLLLLVRGVCESTKLSVHCWLLEDRERRGDLWNRFLRLK